MAAAPQTFPRSGEGIEAATGQPAPPPVMMMNPETGDIHEVPWDQADAARAAGGREAVKMLSPKGEAHWIPKDQAPAALAAGGSYPPTTSTLPTNPAEAAERFVGGILPGMAQASAASAAGIANRLEQIPGVGPWIRQQEQPGSALETAGRAITGVSSAQARQLASAPMDTGGKKAGAALWDAAEFMAQLEGVKAGGAAAMETLAPSAYVAKVMPYLKSLESVKQVQQFAAANPEVTALLQRAGLVGPVGAAQAYLHGATPGQAAQAGATQSLLDIIVGGAGPRIADWARSGLDNVSSFLNGTLPTSKVPLPTTTPIPPEPVRPTMPTAPTAPVREPGPGPMRPVPTAPSPITPTPVLPRPEAPTPIPPAERVTPTVVEQPTPEVFTPPDRAPAGERVQDIQQTFAQGADVAAQAAAAQHMETLNDIIRHPTYPTLSGPAKLRITQERNALLDYLQNGVGTPTPPASRLVNQVGDFGDAADLLRAAPDAHDAALDELSKRGTDIGPNDPGPYMQLVSRIRALEGSSAINAPQQLADARRALQQMLDQPRMSRLGTSSPAIRAIYDSQRADAAVLDQIDNAFNQSFTGAAQTGDLNYDQLQRNWRNVVNTNGADRIRSLIGDQHFDTMNSLINEISGEPAQDLAGQAAVDQRNAQAMSKFQQDVRDAKTLDQARQAAVNAQRDAQQAGLDQMHQEDLAAHARAVQDASDLDAAQKAAGQAQYRQEQTAWRQEAFDRQKRLADIQAKFDSQTAQYNALMQRQPMPTIEPGHELDPAYQQQIKDFVTERDRLTNQYQQDRQQYITDKDKIVNDNKIAIAQYRSDLAAEAAKNRTTMSNLLKTTSAIGGLAEYIATRSVGRGVGAAAAVGAGGYVMKRMLQSPLTAQIVQNTIRGVTSPSVSAPIIAGIMRQQEDATRTAQGPRAWPISSGPAPAAPGAPAAAAGEAPQPTARMMPESDTAPLVGQAIQNHPQVDPNMLQNVVNSIIFAGERSGPSQVSPKGAVGTMQLLPATASRFGGPITADELKDPTTNIQRGTAYVAWLMNHYNNDVSKVVAAYNAGEGAIDRAGGNIPRGAGYDQTRAYVPRVMAEYARRAGNVLTPPGVETSAEQSATPNPEARPGPYRTDLSPTQERQFQQWVKDNNVPFRDAANSNYDMRGYWLNEIQQGGGNRGAVNPSDQRFHFPDTYKTPYHTKFSNESKYALPSAPHWVGDDKSGWMLVDRNGRIVVDERPLADRGQ